MSKTRRKKSLRQIIEEAYLALDWKDIQSSAEEAKKHCPERPILWLLKNHG